MFCKKGKLRSEEMRKIVEERVRLARSTAPQGSSDLLVRQPQVISWGTKKTFNPENLVSMFVGYPPVMGWKQGESGINTSTQSWLMDYRIQVLD